MEGGSDLRDHVTVVVAVPELGDALVRKVFLESQGTVDDASGAKLHDAVRDGAHELVVVAREQEHPGELDQAVLQATTSPGPISRR